MVDGGVTDEMVKMLLLPAFEAPATAILAPTSVDANVTPGSVQVLLEATALPPDPAPAKNRASLGT